MPCTCRGLGFGVWGLGIGDWGLGFGVWNCVHYLIAEDLHVSNADVALRSKGSVVGLGLGFRVWGLGFGVWGLVFGVCLRV